MDKREKVLHAAMMLFNKYGFDKTSTARITKEAGVAIGTLFHYFDTKEDLINALYLYCKDSMSNRLIQGVELEKTLRGKLKRTYMNYLDWGFHYQDEFLFFQQFSNSPYIREMTREEGLSKINDMTALITDGIENDILKEVSLNYLYSVIVGILNANILYFISNPELLQDKDFLEASFNILWDGIKK